MSGNILCTTSSFGTEDRSPLELLASRGFELIMNPYKRKLSDQELHSLTEEYRPAGLIAGTENLDCNLMNSCSEHLRVISRVGSGLDNVDLKAAHSLGIQVYRTSDAVTDSVAELTIALFFSLARKIPQSDRDMHAGLWNKRMGCLLRGKHLGLVGCGRIGRRVAESMKSLGLAVSGYDPLVEDWFRETGIPKETSLRSLFEKSDLLSFHCAPDNTEALLDQTTLSFLKPGVLLVNVSRGSVITEDALLQGINAGTIAGAALDVYQKEPYQGPLQKIEQVILTPHIGSYARESRIQMEKEAVENLLKGLAF